MLSIRALECLVKIVEHGSLTKAARRLHLSQSALSYQVAAIERELGTAVIERLPQGVRPTAAGLAAASEAEVALDAVGRVVAAGRQAAAGVSGRIRIACAETMTSWILVPVLGDWRRRFPDVAIEVKEYSDTDQMLDFLLQGEADISVGPRPSRTSEHIEVLGWEEMVVVAPLGHRFSKMAVVPLAELLEEPMVHYDSRRGSTGWVERFAAQHGTSLPEPALRNVSSRTAAQLAVAGMGVAVVPSSALFSSPGGAVRILAPTSHRDVVAIVAAPHDTLLKRFVIEIKRHPLPDWRVEFSDLAATVDRHGRSA